MRTAWLVSDAVSRRDLGQQLARLDGWPPNSSYVNLSEYDFVRWYWRVRKWRVSINITVEYSGPVYAPFTDNFVIDEELENWSGASTPVQGEEYRLADYAGGGGFLTEQVQSTTLNGRSDLGGVYRYDDLSNLWQPTAYFQADIAESVGDQVLLRTIANGGDVLYLVGTIDIEGQSLNVYKSPAGSGGGGNFLFDYGVFTISGEITRSEHYEYRDLDLANPIVDIGTGDLLAGANAQSTPQMTASSVGPVGIISPFPR